MNTILPRIAKSAVATCLAACLTGIALAQQSPVQLPDRLASYEMTWASPKVPAVAERARAMAASMTGVEQRNVTAVKAPSTDRRMSFTAREAPELEILYLADYDELRIVDTELAASIAPERELTQAQALEIARKVFDDLARRKALEPRDYDWKNADIASTWVGRGSRANPGAERKRVEYRITLRRTLNGIEVANAGLRIGVHMSGRISTLRLGGVSVAARRSGDAEEPAGKGRWLTAGTTLQDVSARFEREAVPAGARPAVAWAKVMYVMPENRRSAVVEPMYVVSYALQIPSDEGATVVSRRKTVGFPLTKAGAGPVDLTPPVRPPRIEKEDKKY